MAYITMWIICITASAFIQGATGYSCHTGYGIFEFSYCEYGCCGHYSRLYDEYEYCCSKEVAGTIAGCIVGGLILTAVIVIICICYQKNRAAARRVIQPVGFSTGGPTVVMAATNQTSGSYGYGPGTQYPPPAQQFGAGSSFSQHPPPYTSDGAYSGATGEKGHFQPQY